MAKPNKKAPLGTAWFAGFMEGEGTISLTTRHSRNGRKNTYWEPCVSVVNTNYEIMKRIQDTFGGSISNTALSPSRAAHHKVCYQIKWHGTKALHLLEEIIPYLEMKLRQAVIVRDYIIHVSATPAPGRAGLAETSLEYRRNSAEQVQLLNKKGV
jgi:hypothetical protein